MIYGLTEENIMIAETVRAFVEKEIYPHEAEVERTGVVPKEIAQDIKRKTLDLGFYACNFPESVGCADLNHREFALVERELGRGSMALNHFFGRPQNILMACKNDQIDRYLMPAVRGEKMDALAMTEPGAGSDVRGMKCSAVRDGGDWVVNGTKHLSQAPNTPTSSSFSSQRAKTKRRAAPKSGSPHSSLIAAHRVSQSATVTNQSRIAATKT